MQKIRDGRQRGYKENPQDEIAAMQHLSRFRSSHLNSQPVLASTAIRDTKTVEALDFCYDDQNLYTITEFYSGGDLWELLHQRQRFTEVERQRFTEAESRQFLRSILDGVEWLQRAGLTHKDISLENIMVNGGSTVIIDLGMCLRVPFLGDQLVGTDMPPQRCLVNGRSPCGKVRLYAFFFTM